MKKLAIAALFLLIATDSYSSSRLMTMPQLRFNRTTAAIVGGIGVGLLLAGVLLGRVAPRSHTTVSAKSSSKPDCTEVYNAYLATEELHGQLATLREDIAHKGALLIRLEHHKDMPRRQQCYEENKQNPQELLRQLAEQQDLKQEIALAVATEKRLLDREHYLKSLINTNLQALDRATKNVPTPVASTPAQHTVTTPPV